jgi:dihydrofolate reductase
VEPTLSIIAAIGKNREIGKRNDLLWRIPDDLKRFRRLTTGHAVVMGQRTYESIGKPLPRRTNIVMTKDASFKADGCVVVGSVEDALASARKVEQEEIFIIGGGMIYALFLPLCDRLYLTMVEGADADADVFFPAFEDDFELIGSEGHVDPKGLKYRFTQWKRVD